MKQFYNWGFFNSKVFTMYPALFLRTRKVIAPSLILLLGIVVTMSFWLGSALPLLIFASFVACYLAWVAFKVAVYRDAKPTLVLLALIAFTTRSLVEGIGFYLGVIDSIQNLFGKKVHDWQGPMTG
jgi:hypothetical protein